MKKDSKINFKKIYLIAIVIASLLMSIGYARVGSVTSELVGLVNAKKATGVFIYDATINASSPADVYESNISIMYSTMMQSRVVLNENVNSTLTMNITIYNKSDDDVYFDKTVYGENFYDNNNIDFTLSGITHGQKLSKNDNVSFTMTFKYTDAYKASNPSTFTNVLNSYIGFEFKKGCSITYTNISGSGYPSLILEGENLNVDFGSNAPTNIKVVGASNTEYVLGTDYTYSNGVLNFPGVSESLEISKVNSGGGGDAGTVITENDDGSTTTVVSEEDGNGNVVVTGYELDTEDTQNGSIPVPDHGIDSGVLVFDGHDFDVTLVAKFTFSDVDPSKTNPVLDLSIPTENGVSGFLILVANNYGGTNYNETGATISGGSSNRYIKFRFNKYTDGVLDSNNRDYYHKNGNTAFYSNRFATRTAQITLTIKVYCRNGQFTSEILYNDQVLAKPRYLSANNPYVFTFNNSVEGATVKVGTWTNNNDVELKSNFDIISFNVTKILD